ncbi:TetR/AcrR family transcriptional regulator [Dictyobacter kobayashii]|uniref:TetR family transcriptional regulator n=1 Tax=Dictyobacter kobayashii TaxID=2014872 RepID=A0A402ARP5_9CHLR|nr:TetR/AcrR family transcriptional regulator [Dictyobacter kobayashii]GCE21768.1 TetR family transcriptional regulator [Dictyobacter kobayashii]
MSHNPDDLRVRRTRKLLRDALIELIEERGFDALTVGEIAQRAMVSRAAFYRYYQDKYDLVEKIFEDAIQTLTREIEPLRRDVFASFDAAHQPTSWAELFKLAEVMEEFTPEPWVKLFEHFEEYERFYRVMLGKKGSSWFSLKMREYLTEIASERLQAFIYYVNGKRVSGQRPLIEGLLPTLITAQLVDSITWWLESGRPYPARQIATYCFRLIFATIKEVSNWE